jgi:hypothetical protein
LRVITIIKGTTNVVLALPGNPFAVASSSGTDRPPASVLVLLKLLWNEGAAVASVVPGNSKGR